MTSLKKSLLLGFLVWVIPLVVAFIIFPLRENERALFESIMPVAVTLISVLCATVYFRKVKQNFLSEGLLLGLIWLAMSIAFDLVLFMQGPMKMTLLDYIKDIGITYLIIPIITIGFGKVLQLKK